MPVDHVLKLVRSDNPPILVDVRSRQSFENVRIPGSINVPLHFIKAKPFLRRKPLILVNEGYACSDLINACRILNSRGFDARILYGGITAWSRDDGPVDGDLLFLAQSTFVPSIDFHREKNAPHWLYVNISNDSAVPLDVPQQAVMNLNDLAITAVEEKLPAIMAQVEKRRKIIGVPPLLLFVSQDGSGDEKVMKALKDKAFLNVFSLQGGLNAYSNFIERTASSRKPREERLLNLDNCRTCGE